MKGKKLYISIISVLAITIMYLLTLLTQERGVSIGNINGNELVRPEEWNVIITADINNNRPVLEVDGKNIEFTDVPMYLNQNLDMMIPIYVLSDAFKCAINKIDVNYIELQKGNNIVKIFGAEEYVSTEYGALKIQMPMVYKFGELFVNARVIEMGLVYSRKWNASDNILHMVNASEDDSILPHYYNYRDIGRLPAIKDQGIYGTCWAFSAMGALESSMLPFKKYDFSEENMTLNSSYDKNMKKGGSYQRAIAYLTSWKGPVLEEDDVYGDGKVNYNAKPVKHVQEVQFLESKNIEAIKRAVFLKGGVESTLYTSMNKLGDISWYYNPEYASYCYIGTETPNHDVVIVGWDDNYPKEAFNTKIEANGAFICMNSWGEQFGDGGLFYVSYYDSNIGMHAICYTGIEAPNNYDCIYQSDLCGYTSDLGYEEDTAYFSNVYDITSNEELKAIGFYALGKNTTYEIYYVDSFQDASSFENKRYIQSGKLNNGGYYTVELNKPIELSKNQRCAIIVKIKTPGYLKPVAVERTLDGILEADIDDGEGYISYTGRSWERVEESKKCNICLKMYTNYTDNED